MNVEESAATPFARRVGLACAVLSYSLLHGQPAQADARIRVVGSVVIEASASRSASTNVSELEARLLDDSGRPVPGAPVEIRVLSATAGAASVRECHARATLLAENGLGAYTVTTNGSGALCVRLENAGDPAELELAYRDARGLYAPVTRRVLADSASRSIEMAFTPAPSVLALERDSHLFTVATRPTPPLSARDTPESVEVTLRASRDGSPPFALGTGSMELGSSAEFRVPSAALGAPGPLELSAEFDGTATTRRARAVARVTTTALAVLALEGAIAPGNPESGLAVRVTVRSVAGPVPSGLVEARSSGAIVGSARVVSGQAEVIVQLDEALAKAHPITLRYLSDSPYWVPSSALEVDLPVLPPSPWRRLGWLAAAAALGSWLLLGWQRPRRQERSAGLGARPSVRAPIDVLEVGDAREGWHGRVVDAHDGEPIAGATVLVRLPSFDASGVLRTAHTDDAGAFVLQGIDSTGPGAALEVRAPLHAQLAAPMPPPGTLLLSLVSRRRSLVARFVEWAAHDGGWERRGEATPGEVARRTERQEVAHWASAVDEAVFGAEPLTEAKEQAVVSHEPAHGRKPALKDDRV